MININEDKPVIFLIKGNYADKKHNFYPAETLYEAWKKYIGKTIEWGNFGLRKVSKVDIQGDFIFIETIKI